MEANIIRKRKFLLLIPTILSILIVTFYLYFYFLTTIKLTNIRRASAGNAVSVTLEQYWSGRANFLPPEEIRINDEKGVLRSIKSQGIGRFAVLNGNDGTIYAYFRDEVPCKDKKPGFCFNLYSAISKDNGLSFSVVPSPVLAQKDYKDIGYIDGIFDPDVVYFEGTYYMVFEGYGNPKCKSFVGLATSLKPTEGWDVKSILVCSKNLVKHPSTPNLFQDSKNNWYLQWVALDSQNRTTGRYQVSINLKDSKRVLTENKNMLQQSPSGKWDERNFGSGNVIREENTYYMFFEGANNWRCNRDNPYNESLWGIGLAKIDEESLGKRLWEKSAKNPILTPTGLNSDSCWIGYPEIVTIDNNYFLYYYDPLTNWAPNDNSRTTFRRKLVSCDSCNFTKVTGKIIIDKTKNPHPDRIGINTCTDKIVTAFKTATNRYTFMLELPLNQKYCLEFNNGSEVISIKNQVAGKYCKKDPSGCNQDEIREDLPDDTSFQIHIK